MNDISGHRGAYGKQLGKAFHIHAAPSFVTHSLHKTEIAVTQIKCDLVDNERTLPVRREHAYLVNLQVRDFTKRRLWMDGKPVHAPPMKAGSVSIFDLRKTWIGERVSPLHAISFYLPRRALDTIADIEGVARIDHVDHDPCLGADDPTIASLGMSLMPAFERPEEANQLFVDHITSATAAHVLFTYGVGKQLSEQRTDVLTPGQEQRVKDLLMANLDGSLTVAQLANECGLSLTGFNRAFVRSTGLTPHKWLLEQRINKSMALLRGSDVPLDEVAASCGFVDRGHFVRVFTRVVGTNPRAWQRVVKH